MMMTNFPGGHNSNELQEVVDEIGHTLETYKKRRLAGKTVMPTEGVMQLLQMRSAAELKIAQLTEGTVVSVETILSHKRVSDAIERVKTLVSHHHEIEDDYMRGNIEAEEAVDKLNDLSEKVKGAMEHVLFVAGLTLNEDDSI